MKSILLAQVNNTFGAQAFLPYSAGCLEAYALTNERVRENYSFRGYVYLREDIDSLVKRHPNLDVLGVSCYIWNWNYSKALARAFKEANPGCLVVLGGPQVPTESEGFFKAHPYADLLVHFEGELAFVDLLLENLKERPDFTRVPGLSVNLRGVTHKSPARERITDLEALPSPYLAGVFDPLLNHPYSFHPTYESNRGCPFACSFCISGDTFVDLVSNKNSPTMIKDLVGLESVEVWSYGLSLMGSMPRRATAFRPRRTRSNAPLVRVFLHGNGSHRWNRDYLDCTPDHELLALKNSKWAPTPASSLRAGDLVQSFSNWTEVRGVQELPGLHDVYCLEVPEFGWFFANGILVSNCDWGSSVFTKVRKLSESRLYGELDWFSRNKMDLVYSADANFGLYERDVDLTRHMVGLKKESGFPNKFRAAYAKNSGERVYLINKMLHQAGMSKGATLSFQSMDEKTLTAVKRKNIGVGVYRDLMKKYRAEGIPTYSELIIGLPGETYDSFAGGLDTLLNSGAHDALQVYSLECLPNSELSQPGYRERYGLKTSVVPVLFFHGTPAEDAHREEYELVVSTNTLPPEDWMKCQMLAWAVQGLHCLGLTQKLAVFCKHHLGLPYRSFYEGLLRWAKSNPLSVIGEVAARIETDFRGIPEGRGWGVLDPRFGDVIWPPEEGAYLQIYAGRGDRTGLYLTELLESFLVGVLGLDYSVALELIIYQSWSIPNPLVALTRADMVFDYALHEYLEGCYSGSPGDLKEELVRYRFHQHKLFNGDLVTYAKEVVWYNRKGGTMFNRVERVG